MTFFADILKILASFKYGGKLSMGKTKEGRYASGLKELRKTKKRTALNTSKKSYLKTLTKQVEAAINDKDKDNAVILLKKAFSMYDKAAKTNTVSKQRVSRKKSQLYKQVASL
ncbi:MAG: 30S ribosomal protein S20 [Bacteroidetes bacterium]|nr:30S ribosomal protein S20 [Bacteroidota bacterium]